MLVKQVFDTVNQVGEAVRVKPYTRAKLLIAIDSNHIFNSSTFFIQESYDNGTTWFSRVEGGSNPEVLGQYSSANQGATIDLGYATRPRMFRAAFTGTPTLVDLTWVSSVDETEELNQPRNKSTTIIHNFGEDASLAVKVPAFLEGKVLGGSTSASDLGGGELSVFVSFDGGNTISGRFTSAGGSFYHILPVLPIDYTVLVSLAGATNPDFDLVVATGV